MELSLNYIILLTLVGVTTSVAGWLIGKRSNWVQTKTARTKLNQDYYTAITQNQQGHIEYLRGHGASVKIVPNINPHHAADKEYIAIYPYNQNIEPAHFTVEEYQKGVDRLKEHPEDKQS